MTARAVHRHLLLLALSSAVSSLSTAHPASARCTLPRVRFSTSPELILLRGSSDAEGVVSLEVLNAGSVPVSLSTELALEQWVAGRWRPSARAPALLALRTDCVNPPDQCRTLAPGEHLRLVPWTGYNAVVQCPGPSPSDFRAPAGEYRVVARRCDGARRFPGRSIDRTHLRPL